MADETWKTKSIVRDLMDTLKASLLWAWYVLGIILSVSLWFFPLPEKSVQAFCLAGVLVIYSLMSTAIAKIKAVRTALES